MTFSQFTSKLNWRLMAVHLVAYWFLWEAFKYFAVLYDFDFVVDFYHHYFSKHITDDKFRRVSPNDFNRLLHYNMAVKLIPLSTFVIALVLSVVISIIKRWYWLNSVIVFILVLALFVIWGADKIHISPWTYLQYVFGKPGYFFKGAMYFITNGAVLLIISLSLFFWKPITRFIEGKKVAVTPMGTPGRTDVFEAKT